MRHVLALSMFVSLCGCALLPDGKKSSAPRVYLLQASTLPTPVDSPTCPTLQVTNAGSEAGFRSNRIAYMRDPLEIEYFAYSRWAGSPDRLISSAARRVFDASGQFEAVIGTPAAATTKLRLEIGDVRLVQRFDGDESSRVELALEARLYDAAEPELLATRRFEATGQAGSNPESGVRAANDAVDRLVTDLLEFVVGRCTN